MGDEHDDGRVGPREMMCAAAVTLHDVPGVARGAGAAADATKSGCAYANALAHGRVRGWRLRRRGAARPHDADPRNSWTPGEGSGSS